MDERLLHNRVIMPVLKAKGATHVRYVHGAFERGKDIIYVYRDFDDDLCLRVCQVKNEKLTGKASGPSSAMGVLRQLEQCRETAVLNPVTNTKELPQEVALYTTYPIPDHAVADGAAFLDRLRATRCKVFAPEALVNQIRDSLPQLYAELAIPGSSVAQAMERYVVVHREAVAFDLEPTRHLADIFVNLGLAPSSTALKALLSGAATAKSPHSVEIHLDLYNDLREMHANLQADFAPAELLERASWEIPKRARKSVPRNRDEGTDGRSAPAQTRSSERLDYVSLNTVRFKEFLVGTARYTRDVRKRIHKAASEEKRREIFSGAMASLSECLYLMEQLAAVFGDSVISSEASSKAESPNFLALPTVDPATLLDIPDHICIEGEAGAGKTCFARQLARHALRQGLRCLYFPCSWMQRDNARIVDAIKTFVASNAAGAEQQSIAPWIREADLIILDGCDEAALEPGEMMRQVTDLAIGQRAQHKVTVDEEDRLQVPSDLSEIVEHNKRSQSLRVLAPITRLDARRMVMRNLGTPFEKPLRRISEGLQKRKPRLVITTRESSGIGLPRGFVRVRLVPFGDDQLQDFFTRWFRQQASDASEVLAFLNKNPHIREICRTPMLATLVAALHGNRYDLPRSRAEVYDRRFDLLLERWDRIRSVPSRNRIRPRDKRSFLARLALRLHKRRRRTFTKENAAQVWTQGYQQAYEDVTVDDLLWELQSCNCVIVPEGPALYTLGHLSYQEFLAAWAIVHSQDFRVLRDNFHAQWWRNVLVFYAGIAGDVARLFAAVQTKGTLDDRSLIDEMLAEARYTPEAVRAAVKDIFGPGDIR
ncbi:MAG: NACHT domain-containing protein [Planctomycetes bacterium]|nr:NACHT domain-containing protein [Planctomycetota bacterium]